MGKVRTMRGPRTQSSPFVSSRLMSLPSSSTNLASMFGSILPVRHNINTTITQSLEPKRELSLNAPTLPHLPALYASGAFHIVIQQVQEVSVIPQTCVSVVSGCKKGIKRP